MRSFVTAGILALISAILSTSIALYAQDYVGQKMLREQLISKAADWQKIITIYDQGLEGQTKGLTLEKLKDMIAAQRIGDSGYIWARDTTGVYQVSKNRKRDGENIWDVQDADGNYIVRHNTEVALQAPEGGNYTEYYWQNNDDPRPRKKVAGLAYVKELDWVIGASAYYDDAPVLPKDTLVLFVISLMGFGMLFFGFVLFTRSNRIGILNVRKIQ